MKRVTGRFLSFTHSVKSSAYDVQSSAVLRLVATYRLKCRGDRTVTCGTPLCGMVLADSFQLVVAAGRCSSLQVSAKAFTEF